MTQLYVGNLSTEGDEKAIRILFGKYGPVREVLMKNGYAFVEFESPMSADEAMRELNGSDILGHPMIVEPSHQQRLSSRRKVQHGKVEVNDIPPHFTFQNVQAYMSQIGPLVKLEIEETEFGMKKVIVTYETQEQAQRAVALLGEGDEHVPRVVYVDTGLNGMRSGVTTRKTSPGIPSSPSKNNSDFPLRILVPSDMVGAIIGKDGATIRMITQITKARVDVHRRENLGTAEKAITTIGPPECCTEACYQIMKIMQNELLMTNGMESGKFHEPLPVVPLKILAHNELVGRVIGKGGGTLKRIMAESGTKITISKLKDLTAFNMERTITILGTIDNCKKAESLISAKLRASYESDMAQFIPGSDQGGFGSTLSPSPTNIPPPTSQTMGNPVGMGQGRLVPGGNGDFPQSRMPPAGAQSLPATPSSTNVRTFTDYSGEHTRITTLHGSAGALEVNNLGGFTTSIANTGSKFASALESSIDGIVRTTTSMSNPNNGIGVMNEFGSSLNSHMGTGRSGNGVEHLGLGQNLGNSLIPNKHVGCVNGMSMSMLPMGNGNGIGNGIVNQFHSNVVHPQHGQQPVIVGGGDNCLGDVDDLADVFTGLSFKEPSLVAAPGYGRSRFRRSSAPVGNGDQGCFGAVGSNTQNAYGLWGNSGGGGGVNEHGGGVGNGVLPGVNEGGEYGLVPPISRNSPIQQPQHHKQPHHQHYTAVGGGGVNLANFPSAINPHVSFNSAWENTQAANTHHSGPTMGGPIGSSLAGGLNGGGGGSISSGSGSTSSHVSQSIWSQSSFHTGIGVGASTSIPTTIGGSGGGNGGVGSINSGTPAVLGCGESRPNSQTSSYSNSDSSLSGISPIYSPTNNTSGFAGFGSSGNGNLTGTSSDVNPPTSLGLGLYPTAPLGMVLVGGEERESRSPFRASVPTPLTTVTETVIANGNRCDEDDFCPSIVNNLLGENTQPSNYIQVQW